MEEGDLIILKNFKPEVMKQKCSGLDIDALDVLKLLQQQLVDSVQANMDIIDAEIKLKRDEG